MHLLYSMIVNDMIHTNTYTRSGSAVLPSHSRQRLLSIILRSNLSYTSSSKDGAELISKDTRPNQPTNRPTNE